MLHIEVHSDEHVVTFAHSVSVFSSVTYENVAADAGAAKANSPRVDKLCQPGAKNHRLPREIMRIR